MKIITSGLPIAIGTSLALESYLPPTQKPYDLSRVIPKTTNKIHFYNTFYMNMYTLTRNMIGASDTIYTVNEWVSRFRLELHWMVEYIRSVSPRTRVEFYTHNMSEQLVHRSARIRLRLHSTTKSAAKDRFIKTIIDKISNDRTIQVRNYIDGIVGDSFSNAVVLTSFPVDFLKHSTHKSLSHISSHTGIELNRRSFYKLYFKIPSKDMRVFPFNAQLWKFLGDRSLIKPRPVAERKRLYDIAIDKRWNQETTISKIKSNLRDADLELYSIIFNSK